MVMEANTHALAQKRKQLMAALLLDIGDSIAVLRESIQRLIENEPANAECEALILEQLSRQNDELEVLISEREALEAKMRTQELIEQKR